MFEFAHLGEIMWPVDFPQNDAAGNVEQVTVHVRYKLLPRPQLRQRERTTLQRMASKAGQGDTAAPAAKLGDKIDDMLAVLDAASERDDESQALLIEHITGWNADDFRQDGKPVEFSLERLEALLQYDVHFRPLLTGLHEASRHGPAKNSLPGPAGTPARGQA